MKKMSLFLLGVVLACYSSSASAMDDARKRRVLDNIALQNLVDNIEQTDSSAHSRKVWKIIGGDFSDPEWVKKFEKEIIKLWGNSEPDKKSIEELIDKVTSKIESWDDIITGLTKIDYGLRYMMYITFCVDPDDAKKIEKNKEVVLRLAQAANLYADLCVDSKKKKKDEEIITRLLDMLISAKIGYVLPQMSFSPQESSNKSKPNKRARKSND